VPSKLTHYVGDSSRRPHPSPDSPGAAPLRTSRHRGGMPARSAVVLARSSPCRLEPLGGDEAGVSDDRLGMAPRDPSMIRRPSDGSTWGTIQRPSSAPRSRLPTRRLSCTIIWRPLGDDVEGRRFSGSVSRKRLGP
jgi:hypothetical protein